jgi:hypothetical protein
MQRIELFYWEGCPSHPEAKELFEQLLAERGMECRGRAPGGAEAAGS